MIKKPRHEVKVGQVWEDCDPRDLKRKVTIKAIDGNRALVTNEYGRNTRIRLDRFYESSTGYRLIKDVSGD